eukprot:scaffold10597_cov124-Isochrysis_galbana.AAC.5
MRCPGRHRAEPTTGSGRTLGRATGTCICTTDPVAQPSPMWAGDPRPRPWSFSLSVKGASAHIAYRRAQRTHIHTGRSLKSTRRRAALNLQPESLHYYAMNESQQLLQHHPVVVPGMRP